MTSHCVFCGSNEHKFDMCDSPCVDECYNDMLNMYIDVANEFTKDNIINKLNNTKIRRSPYGKIRRELLCTNDISDKSIKRLSLGKYRYKIHQKYHKYNKFTLKTVACKYFKPHLNRATFNKNSIIYMLHNHFSQNDCVPITIKKTQETQTEIQPEYNHKSSCSIC